MADKFFVFRSPDSLRKLAEWMNEVDLEGIICPQDPGHQRGGKRITDLGILIPGSSVDDFLWTWHSDCLVQDSVLKMFRKEGFTGFDVKPVKSRYKRKSAIEPPKLWEIVVLGWGGMASAQSGVKLVYKCPSCDLTDYKPPKDFSNLLDEKQWDGSDFFMVWPFPNFIFVTARVAEFIKKHKLTGVKLKKPEDVEIGEDSIDISPGRLSYLMPEKRAHELGDPLDIF